MYPSSTGGTRIFFQDKEYPELAGGTPIPASTANLGTDSNYYLQVREWKIWNQKMPLQFLTQHHKKQMDGGYYSNVLFYFNAEFNYVWRSTSRKWLSG